MRPPHSPLGPGGTSKQNLANQATYVLAALIAYFTTMLLARTEAMTFLWLRGVTYMIACLWFGVLLGTVAVLYLERDLEQRWTREDDDDY